MAKQQQNNKKASTNTTPGRYFVSRPPSPEPPRQIRKTQLQRGRRSHIQNFTKMGASTAPTEDDLSSAKAHQDKESLQVAFTAECDKRAAGLVDDTPVDKPAQGEDPAAGASSDKTPAEEDAAGPPAVVIPSSLPFWSAAINPKADDTPLDIDVQESEQSWREKQARSMKQHHGMNIHAEVAAAMGASTHASIATAAASVGQSQKWADADDHVLIFPQDGGEMQVDRDAAKEKYTTPDQVAEGGHPDHIHFRIAWLAGDYTKMYRINPSEALNCVCIDFLALAPRQPKHLQYSYNEEIIEPTSCTAESLGLSNGATIYASLEEENEVDNKEEETPADKVKINVAFYDQEFCIDIVTKNTIMGDIFELFYKEAEINDEDTDHLKFMFDGRQVGADEKLSELKLFDEDWLFVERTPIDDDKDPAVEESVEDKSTKKVTINLVMDKEEVTLSVKPTVKIDRIMKKFLDIAVKAGCFPSGQVEPCSFMSGGLQLDGSQTIEYYNLGTTHNEIEVLLDADMEELEGDGDADFQCSGSDSDFQDEPEVGNRMSLAVKWAVNPEAKRKRYKEATFRVNASSKLTSAIPKEIRRSIGRGGERFVLYYDDALVGHDATPSSLGLEHGDLLTAVLLSDVPQVKVKKEKAKKGKLKTTRSRVKKLPRLAGERPTDARQQVDSDVRNKLLQVRQGMQTAHLMSIPHSRSNMYIAPVDPLDASDQAVKEDAYPWVVHTAATFTEQLPNGNGQNEDGELWYDMPRMHFWVGSKQAAAKMKEQFSEVTKVKMVFHDVFEDYMAALSSSGKAPQRKRKTRAQTVAEELAAEERKLKKGKGDGSEEEDEEEDQDEGFSRRI